MPNPRLAIIGGGNMGFAIARGVLSARVLEPADLLIAERDAAKHERFSPLGCPCTTRTPDAVAADQLLLAVKPQHFEAVAGGLAPLPGRRVVMTIMAGIDSTAIRSRLGPEAAVIRMMPNTPCQVGEGMTGIALGDGAEPGDEALARDIFGAVGRIAVVDEHLMHAVTAVSGSGPAYVYLLAEVMVEAARELDLPDAAARLLVEQTIIGAGRMLRAGGEEPARLREIVTTPGGTTAAALDVFDRRDLRGTVRTALQAARDRGRELGGD